MSQAIIKFPAGNINIDLLDTPAVEVWKEALSDFNAHNFPMFTQPGRLLSRGSSKWSTEREVEYEANCVKEINQAIEDFNNYTTGMRFPYSAFEDMPWEQTNLIHRCFTTALGSVFHGDEEDTYRGGTLVHTMTTKQLKEYKKIHTYDNRRIYFSSKKLDFYFQTKDHKHIYSALHRINKWVHLYENRRRSLASAEFYNYWQDKVNEDETVSFPMHVNIGWDIFTEDGSKKYNKVWHIRSNQIEASVPKNWMDYDVFLIKSITGKDYETCYQNYDNPMEYDIQNVQHVNGSVRIFPNGGHREIYNDKNIGGWCKSYGLKEYQYAPVPLGKITHSDFNLTSIKTGGDNIVNTNGAPSALPAFNKPVISLI